MTTTHNQRREAPNAADLLNGNYLSKTEIQGARIVTITDVWSEFFKVSGKWKMIMQFEEHQKPFILNTTNTQELVEIFATKHSQYWRGPITLYHDPAVQYTGKVDGGLRVNRAVVQAPVEVPQVPQVEHQPPVVEVPKQYPNGAAADGHIRRHESDVY